MNNIQILETTQIKLRALEPADVELLYAWENNTALWNVGSTIAPFSRKTLTDYVANSHLSVYEVGQLRLMIDHKQSGKTIGAIDLYDFDARNLRAGVGIYVVEEFQQQGFASESLACLLHYCKETLLLHQCYAEIPAENHASLNLFQHAGFETIGTKKDWLATTHGFVNVVLLQKIL